MENKLRGPINDFKYHKQTKFKTTDFLDFKLYSPYINKRNIFP